MGFDNERLATRGKLVEVEMEARQMQIRIHALASSIRAALPAFADIEELEAEKAATLAVELAGLHAEYLGMQEKIRAMRRALGM